MRSACRINQGAMNNILLTGTYSSKNKGDAAMQLCTAEALVERTGADITIHSPFPETDRLFYLKYRVISSSRRRLLWCTYLWARAKLWYFLKDRFGLDIKLLLENLELRAFLQADVIVDLSGDMLTDDYGPHVAYSHYLPIMIALALKRPVCLCAQTIGPFKYTGWLALALINRVDYISVRDRLSLNYLQSFDLNSPRPVVTADMALLLRPAEPRVVDDIFAREGVPSMDAPILGVAVSFLIAKHFQKKCRGTGLTFFETLAGELDAMIDEFGVKVVFVGQVTGPTMRHDDREAARQVRRHMNKRDQAHVFGGDYSPAEVKGIISRFTLLLGARMHANIAALSTGVPAIALSYSMKTPGIMSLFDFNDYVVDISELGRGQLVGLAKALMRNRQDISDHLKRTSVGLGTAALKNIDGIIQAVEKRG